jgi:dipeptidyl aminopeptidase/acylaminoacyl peptidase
MRRRLKFLSVLLLCLQSVNANAQGVNRSSALGPLPVEIASTAKTFGNTSIDLSPDGLWVAYTLSDPRRRKVQGLRNDQWFPFNCTGSPYSFSDSDVLITHTQTGQTINISTGRGANWAPRWSPDGKYLAFYSDRTGKAHVWVWERSTPKLRPLTTAVVHVRFGFKKILWTPDSRHVITKVLGAGQTLGPCFDGTLGQRSTEPSSKLVYDSEGAGPKSPLLTDSFLGDIAALEVATGKLKRIVRQQGVAGYSLSPTGDKIVFSLTKRQRPDDQYLLVYDLAVVSLSDLQTKTTPDFLPGVPSLPVSWSPNGHLVAYLSKRECFIWDLRGGEPRRVTSAPAAGFAQAPLWDKEGREIYLVGDNRVWKVSATDAKAAKAVSITEKWDRQIRSIISREGGNEFWSTDDGQSLYVSTMDPESKREGIYTVNLQSGKFLQVMESDNSHNFALSAVSPKGDTVVFASQDARHDQNLWIAKQDFANPRQLTHINPELQQYAAGEARLIEFADKDGKKLKATLLLPANYKKEERYPLIVWVYGGFLLSGNVNRYGSVIVEHQNMQLLSSRGYAVLLPDTPLRVGTPMQDLASTVLPAVDKTIEMGVADPERLGIMGTSYGGYSTLALIVQTTRFKAAVMDVGFANLSSMYGVMLKSGMPLGAGWAEEGQGRMGGPPWEFPERYVQNSPLFFLNKVQTPLLINQGAMDMSPHHSNEIFISLKRLGKKVVYVQYENEGHGFVHYGNRIDYWNRVIDWFESHLNLDTNRHKKHKNR